MITATRIFACVTAFAFVVSLTLSAQAQNGEALYKSKCAMCHGADGSKLASHNLQAADAQKLSDAEMSTIITAGKGKMPPTKSLKAEDVTAVVTYVRTLKK